MNELRAVVAAAETARAEGVAALLATVVRVRGSAYRRPGARMLLTEAGWQAGSISGGCLEGDIQRKASWRTRGAQPVVVTYDSTVATETTAADAADLAEELSHGFGLGCNGIVDVLLERVTPGSPGDPIAFVADCLRDRRAGVMTTVIAAEPNDRGVAVGQRLFMDESGLRPQRTIADADLAAQVADAACAALTARSSRALTVTLTDGTTADLFLEVIQPPLPLLICGAGHDAIPLARMASDLGWSATVIDPRAGFLPRPDRFPGAETVLACAPSDIAATVAIDARTFAVVMTHNTALDAALIGALLSTPARYIGVLGPRARTERLIATLRDADVPLPDLDRLHGPVGLDLGGDGPESIALSILAEVQAVAAGRTGTMRREQGHRQGHSLA